MIYLNLFLNFLKIGAVSFGGGYGVIAMIRETALANNWLTEAELINVIGISESTPGPLAVNMATFVGAARGGFLGALLATIGVVLPAFIIMLLVVTVLKNLLKNSAIRSILDAIKPAFIGLIIGTAVTMILFVVLGIEKIGDSILLDYKALIILGILAIVIFLSKYLMNKKMSPICIILIGALLGIIIY